MKAKSILIICLLLASISLEAKKPLIGISASGSASKSSVGSTYINAVRRAGGIPVIVPLLTDESQAKEIMAHLDGILFTGGEDFDPAYYGEKPIPEIGEINGFRDTSDIALARVAVASGKPVLGICRGEQLLNIVCGGSLYQDIPSQTGTAIRHNQKESGTVPTHKIIIEHNSLLYSMYAADTMMVNSHHHEGVKQIGSGLRVIATAPDGIVEAYQSTAKKPRLLAVQFHPEKMAPVDDKWLAIFRWLVNEAE